MRLCLALLKQSASSARWTARQANDPYVRLRTGASASAGDLYRSRSAFKLVSLARKYPILARGNLVFDLGAAPGGWSQVAASKVGKLGRVWAVDLLGMEAIEGVDILRGDFLDIEIHSRLASSVQEHLRRARTGQEDRGGQEMDQNDGLVDTVLSDMMAPMSGVRLKDVQASLDLVEAATGFAKSVLKTSTNLETSSIGDSRGPSGGSLVLKYFAHPDLDIFKRTQLDPFFSRVFVEKPKESRKESSEAYWVCLGYRGNGDSSTDLRCLDTRIPISPKGMIGGSPDMHLSKQRVDGSHLSLSFAQALSKVRQMGRDKIQCPVRDCRREYTDIRMFHIHAREHAPEYQADGSGSRALQHKVDRSAKKKHLKSPARIKEKSKARVRHDSPHPHRPNHRLKTRHSALEHLKHRPKDRNHTNIPLTPPNRHPIDLRTPSLSPDSASDASGDIELLTPGNDPTATPLGVETPRTLKGRPSWATLPRTRSPTPTPVQMRPPVTPTNPHLMGNSETFVPADTFPSPFAVLSKAQFAHRAYFSRLHPQLLPRIGEGNAYDPFVEHAEVLQDAQPKVAESPRAITPKSQVDAGGISDDCKGTEKDEAREADDSQNSTRVERNVSEVDELDDDDDVAPPEASGSAVLPEDEVKATPSGNKSVGFLPFGHSRPLEGLAEASLLRSIGDLFHSAATLATAQNLSRAISGQDEPPEGYEDAAKALVKTFLDNLHHK